VVQLNGQELADARKATEEAIAKEAAAADAVREAEAMAALRWQGWNSENPILVGGLEHLDDFSIYWECRHPN